MNIINKNNISRENISHGNSKKKVFENPGFYSSTFTQAAFSTMLPSEICKEHFHESMIEFFYFISGKGIYTIENKEYTVMEGTYLRIDPYEKHSLKAIEELSFFYMGIPSKWKYQLLQRVSIVQRLF